MDDAISSVLSTNGSIVLAYSERLLTQQPSNFSPRFLQRELQEYFPLFQFLFDSVTSCQDAVDEVRRQGHVERIQDLARNNLLRYEVSDWNKSIELHIKGSLDDILRRLPLEDIAAIVDSKERDYHVVLLEKLLEWRFGATLERAVLISRQYAAAIAETAGSHVEKEKLAQMIAKQAGFQRIQSNTATDKPSEPMSLSWFRASGIVPHRELLLGISVVSTEVDHEIQLDFVSALLDEYRHEILVVLIIGGRAGLRAKLDGRLRRRKIVLLDEQDLKSIAVCHGSVVAFRSHALEQLPLSLITPYRFNGPVTGDIFFGRQGELRRILDTSRTNFCVLGARRIGKSSLLKALAVQINEQHVLRNTVAIYIDLSSHQRIEFFQKSLMNELCQIVDELEWIDPGDEFFEELAEQLKGSHQQYLFLLDEVDNLLEQKDAVYLERFARSLANGGYARFVFCGYRTLNDRIHNRATALHNLCDTIYLGPLNRIEAAELVRTPMEAIGVQFDKSAVVDEILKLGSTVPWLLQYFCYLLVDRLDQQGGDRKISLDIVHEAYTSELFSSAMTSSISQDGDLPILEQLIVYIALNAPNDSLSESEVCEAVRKVSFSTAFTDIRRALSYLTSTYILCRTGDHYRFFVPQLKVKLRERELDLPRVINELASEVRLRKG